jgi:methylmalonyl-CoA mutase cobalamin-binding domain/chain
MNAMDTARGKQDYLEALRRGDARNALQVVDGLVDAGVSFDQLCEDVFRPALYEIGDLWERGEIGVADEHLASAIAETVLACVGSFSSAPLDSRPRVLVCSTQDEAHALGARMVGETFAAAEWSVQYLGASTPIDAVARAVVDREVDVLALSTTMSHNLPVAAETVEAVRAAAPHVRIVVGGQAYAGDPRRAEQVRADLFFESLRDIVETVEAAISPR